MDDKEGYFMNTNIKVLTAEAAEIVRNARQQERDGNITPEQRAEVVANTLKDFERQAFDTKRLTT